METPLILVEVEKLINCVLRSGLWLLYNLITDALTTLVQEVKRLIHGCLAARLIVELIVPDQLVLLGQLKLVAIGLDLQRRQLLNLLQVIEVVQFPDQRDRITILIWRQRRRHF